MPSIKSGRFITAVYKVEEDEQDNWDDEVFNSRDDGVIILVFTGEEAERNITLSDCGLIDVKIHCESFGIKKSGDSYWTLFETWDEAKAAFDKLV